MISVLQYLMAKHETCTDTLSLAWSPTGDYLISGSTDNVARVWNVPTGQMLQQFEDHTLFVQVCSNISF